MSSRVRPSVQEDGGDIFYEGFDPIKVRLFVYFLFDLTFCIYQCRTFAIVNYGEILVLPPI